MFDMFEKKYKEKTVQDSIDQVLAKMEKEEAMQENPNLYEPPSQPISMQQEVMNAMMSGGANPALALMGNQAPGFNGMVDFSNPNSVSNMQNSLQSDPTFIANQNAMMNMMQQTLGAMPNVQVSPAGIPNQLWNGYSQHFPPQMVGNNFGLNPNIQQTQYQNPMDGVIPANPNAFNNTGGGIWYGDNPFQTQGFNTQPSIVGGWNNQPSYYNFYMNDPSNRAAYMGFSEEEIKSGKGFVVKVVSKTDEEIEEERRKEEEAEKEFFRSHTSWEEKYKIGGFKVVTKLVDREPPKQVNTQQQNETPNDAVEDNNDLDDPNKPSQVIIECTYSDINILKEWIYKILPKDYIGLDTTKIIVPRKRRLFFNKRDEEALRNLCKRLEVYNPPLAKVVWNKKHLKYRDDYQLYIEAAEDYLSDYEFGEMHDQTDEGYVDYRVPMRYRKLPEYTVDENGNKHFSDDYNDPLPFRKYTEETFEYEYDRGRELTNEEFEIFCEYEETCLVYCFHQLRLKNICEFNRKLQNLPLSYSVDRKHLEEKEDKLRKILVESINYRKSKQEEKIKMEQQCKMNKALEDPRTLEEIENERYNKLDPIETHYHEMRVLKKRQQQQYELYRDIFSSKSKKEFDAWWYGKNSSQYQQETLPPEELKRKQREEYVDRMTEANIAILSKAQVVDPVQIVNNFRCWQQAELQKLFGNTMNEATTAKDVFEKVIPHALYEISCENIERQRREAMNAPYNPIAYKKALLELANNRLLSGNEDPNFKPGPVDPKYGCPPNWVDPTNSKEYEERKARFMNYCNTSMGVNMPLRPIYK